MSENITFKFRALLPFLIRIGDHYLINFKINTMSFILETPVIIFRPKGKILQIWITRVRDKYIVFARESGGATTFWKIFTKC